MPLANLMVSMSTTNRFESTVRISPNAISTKGTSYSACPTPQIGAWDFLVWAWASESYPTRRRAGHRAITRMVVDVRIWPLSGRECEPRSISNYNPSRKLMVLQTVDRIKLSSRS